jgi:hypothetical protein
MKAYRTLLQLMFILVVTNIFAQNTTSEKVFNQEKVKLSLLSERPGSEKCNDFIQTSGNKPVNASPMPTENTIIRYDNGSNYNSIGLLSGGTFEVAAYFPEATMAQYAGMKLTQMVFYLYNIPQLCKIRIYGAGTSTTPGELLYEEAVNPLVASWNLFDLVPQIDITGEDLWIGYEVTHVSGEYPPGYDEGPAIAGYGDMICLDGISWQTFSGIGYDYNWNLAGFLSNATQPIIDVGTEAFLSPVSLSELEYEVVTIRVKNYEGSTQIVSNIPVFFTLDGESPVNGIVPGPLAPGETTDFTFPGAVNLNNPGHTYAFLGCTALEADNIPENDCKTMNLLWIPNEYCDASTINQHEYIQRVECGDISKYSSWQGGVADYTTLSTSLAAGWPEQISVTVGNYRLNDSVKAWIDWDQNLVFEEEPNEAYILTDVNGNGQSFVGTIVVPQETLPGIYRMRIRLTYNSTPEPCGVAQYGEIEEYTIVVITPLENNVGVKAILSPQSGTNLTDNVVTIRIKNFGTIAQSDIPVFYTVNGGIMVNGIVKGPLEGGASFNYTFPGFVNLGNTFQTFTFVACTFLEADENPDNDCKTNDVTNFMPSYYNCTTLIEDEYIANVLFGDINNSSGWQGGVADYTDQFTMIRSGESETITITNGNAWANDNVYVWIDWNQDYCFATYPAYEQYILTNVGGIGETFTGNITVPEGLACGAYRMRIRMTYSTTPTPGGTETYGEVEDYTLVVKNPDLPEIGVNPITFSQVLYSGQTVTQSQTVSNIGGNPLNFDITLDTLNSTYGEVNQENADTKFIIENQSSFVPFIPGCGPVYCTAITTTEDEYISNVLFGNINNSSYWQVSIADFTNLSTTIEAGASENMTVTNGLPYTNDLVYAWVDWNKDSDFTTADEQYVLTNQNGAGETFTGEISVPQNQPTGNYRLRIRMCYYTEPVPCGGSTYGEVEEYSIHVVNNQTIPWLTVEPMTGAVNPNDSTIVNVTFDATGLQIGTYEGSIIINCNDPVMPFTTIPVILIVGQCPLPPPLNIEGFEILPNVAYLLWQTPEIPGNLLGYNIYRNNQKINPDIVSNLFYEDSLTNPSQYFYHVTAVYPECEASSDTISLVITNLPEKENNGVTIFPNPATNFVNIKSQNSIIQILIMNNLGLIVFSGDFESNSVQVNISGFNKGIYFIRIETEMGVVSEKLVIR